MRNVDSSFKNNLPKRRRAGVAWRSVFLVSLAAGIFFLALLIIKVVNGSAGYAAIEYGASPESYAVNGVPIWDLPKEGLVQILRANLSRGRLRTLEKELPLDQRSREAALALVVQEVLEPKVARTWSLAESLTQPGQVKAEAASEYPDAELVFKSWLTREFITSPQSSDALLAGVRTAILGSLWIIAVAILFALPVGVGAAVYLEEYATDNHLNRLIQTNINNLAGVPSIIYGMLGLAVFVRTFEQFSSGAIFGFSDPASANGRTIVAAGLTIALLILPLIIINAQEAIRAVPDSLRKASYGLGATRWQTICSHVLPNAVPGILTGSILAVSRAFGETAPLVVVGAATYITFDPDSPFSKFTTLPIQIYQWTARPQDEYRNLAAAAILVLLIILLSLNAVAIVLRNRYSRKY